MLAKRLIVLGLGLMVLNTAQAQKTNTGNAKDEAKDVSCLIEGSFTFLGATNEVKDCMENKGGLTQSEIKSACEGLANTSAMMGGQAGKVSYMGSCPMQPIAVCDDVPRKGVSSFYYKAAPNRGASELKSSCAGLGGKAR